MSNYFMMESWGSDVDEPTQKPKRVDFEDWADEYGLDDYKVNFRLGWRLAGLNMPNPIQMVWKPTPSGGGLAWEMEGKDRKPPEGPRSPDGLLRLWMYKAGDPPLCHKTLVEAIRQCGVDNLETFPVAITDTRTGEICHDYLAVNFVGLVKAVDMAKSVATSHSPDGLVDTDFDSVSINESAVGGSKMFRLAESVNALVVHRSIKEHLESLGGFGLTFTEPKDWIG